MDGNITQNLWWIQKAYNIPTAFLGGGVTRIMYLRVHLGRLAPRCIPTAKLTPHVQNLNYLSLVTKKTVRLNKQPDTTAVTELKRTVAWAWVRDGATSPDGKKFVEKINTLKAVLNPICHLLVILGAHHIHHVSRIKVNI
jgi:hypothetical protein